MRSLCLHGVFLYLLLPAGLFGQGGDQLVYRFTVEGIQGRTDAKPLQKALMDVPGVLEVTFIPECTCFKLVSDHPLDRQTVEAMLADLGRMLTGDVFVSDGGILTVPTTPPLER